MPESLPRAVLRVARSTALVAALAVLLSVGQLSAGLLCALPAVTVIGCARAPDPSGALFLAREYFRAAWAGNREAVERMARGAGWGSDSLSVPTCFAFLTSQSSWDLILWRGGSRDLALESEPAFVFLRPPQTGFRCKVKASYEVLVQDQPDASAVRYAFTELIELVYAEGRWWVESFERWGIPYCADGGASPGWAVAGDRVGSRFRCGPFSQVGDLSRAQWDPAARRLAFVAANFDRLEIWSAEPAAGTVARLVSMPVEYGLARPSTLTVDLLGWSADGEQLRFMVGGDQTAGPHAGAKGFWIASVAGSGGPAATLAFVAAEEGPFGDIYHGWPAVAADRSMVSFCHDRKLYRVNLTTGRVDCLASDLPHEDSRFRLSFSPDGRTAARGLFEAWPGQGAGCVTLLALGTGSRTELAAPGGAAWWGLDGWSPDGLLVMREAPPPPDAAAQDDAQGGPVPGALRLRLYSPQGAPRGTVSLSPGNEDRLIGPCAWAPDGSALAYVAAQELWVWDREAGESVKLAPVGGNDWRLDWPASSLLLAGTLGLEVSRNGGWQAEPAAWAPSGGVWAFAGQWHDFMLVVLEEPIPGNPRGTQSYLTLVAGGEGVRLPDGLEVAELCSQNGYLLFTDRRTDLQEYVNALPVPAFAELMAGP